MDWVGPWQGGQRRDWRDPWSSLPYTDLWDPLSYSVGNRGGDQGDDTSALAHAHVDWRGTDKAHLFRADLPG